MFGMKPKPPLQPLYSCTRSFPNLGRPVLFQPTSAQSSSSLSVGSIPTPGPLRLLLLPPAPFSSGSSQPWVTHILSPQKTFLCSSHAGELFLTSTPTGQGSGQHSTIYQKVNEEGILAVTASSCAGKENTLGSALL